MKTSSHPRPAPQGAPSLTASHLRAESGGWVFAVWALCCCAASADTAIYRTSGTQTAFGFDNVQRVAARGFFLFNTQTNQITNISSFRTNGLKLFSVRVFTAHRIDVVNGPHGTTYTVITFAAAPSTDFAGVLMESLYLRGLNSNVALSTAGTSTVPRTFALNARTVVETGGKLGSGESTGTFVLDIAGSRASNLFETYDTAVARFTSYYTGLGYTQVVLPPAP